MRNKYGELYNCLPLLSGKVSRLWYKEVELVEAASLSDLRRWDRESEEVKVTRVPRVCRVNRKK
jgi:hypothetical protein